MTHTVEILWDYSDVIIYVDDDERVRCPVDSAPPIVETAITIAKALDAEVIVRD